MVTARGWYNLAPGLGPKIVLDPKSISGQGVPMRFILTLFLLCGLAHGSDAAPSHPLDPLTGEEISTAIAVLKADGRVTDATRFPAIVLNEPVKEKVLAFKSGDSMGREALVVVYERTSNQTVEAVVDLIGHKLL